MKKTISMLSVLSVLFVQAWPVQAATVEWRPARVIAVEVLETFPPTYEITFESRCDDVEAQTVKVAGKDELVLGVITKNDSSVRCGSGQPIVIIQRIRVQGEVSDPTFVSVLR